MTGSPSYGELSTYGNVKTQEFVWELKRGFVNTAVSRAIRLRESPLSELPLCISVGSRSAERDTNQEQILIVG